MRGTLLNAAAVAGGALVGMAVGQSIPKEYQDVVLQGLGLVILALGIKLFIPTHEVIYVAAAIALGGVLGRLFGIQAGLDAFAEFARVHLGGQPGTFNAGLIATSVLFCVGPMTLLGCLQDGLEGKIELLAIKSTLDGICAIFFAAAMGSGVLVTAFVVLIVQGSLTLAARQLRGIAADESLVKEASSVGGILLIGIGLGLLGIKQLQIAAYLPALVLMPMMLLVARKWPSKAKRAAQVG